MGEKQIFQPLTREDRITVVLYRVGLVMAALIMGGLAFLMMRAMPGTASVGTSADVLAYGLYAAVGVSVSFIHLYVGTFKTYLKNLYFTSLGCLVVLLYLGEGSLVAALAQDARSALLLLPLSGCLGFMTAKEAFCFRLLEGYLLAMIMPLYLVLVAGGILAYAGASNGLALIAVLLALFTVRKVFMPIAWDIGDKSAYR